jgi:gamma-butyrobetaine dioxygenase
MTEPLTPDFYHYPSAPLQSAVLADGFVTVSWPDGLTFRGYSLWFAENVYGFGLEPQTRESMIDPADLPKPEALHDASIGAAGELILTWSLGNGLVTAVHPGWLRHVAEAGHRPSAHVPPQELWTATTFIEPPTVDGSNILTDDAVLTEWLTLMCRFGVARLVGTPATEDFVGALATHIGPIRSSNFGDVFDVKADIDPNSTANTGLNLGQHTDLPTRETPPGFQFLHCVKNNVAGGRSRMTDGLAVVHELRTNHTQAYEALTTLRWIFFNRSPEADHRWSGPLIDHVDDGYPLTMRAFYPVRGFPDMADADIPRAYEAMRVFSVVAHDPQFQISSAFTPGDLVGFDNRRILHGRDAFEVGGGKRHLRGCYLDHDDVYSRLRVLNRR